MGFCIIIWLMSEKPKVIHREIKAETGDHVFITIYRPDRPTISIDYFNDGGLGIRSDGFGIADVNVFLKPDDLPMIDFPLIRYCPVCGQKIDFLSSAPHHCKEN